jgi:hypothetical protein
LGIDKFIKITGTGGSIDMSLARRYPIIGVIVGIVFTVFGIIKNDTVFLIVGIVVLALAVIRRMRA